MGRLEETWGKDCLEFKPERWISERGGIVHNPSYKFFSFNAGPRTCLGKDLSFIQIKMIAISILCKYRVLLVEGRVPLLSHSIILLMKNGFKVRITKREI
jgi:cytochrome P450